MTNDLIFILVLSFRIAKLFREEKSLKFVWIRFIDNFKLVFQSLKGILYIVIWILAQLLFGLIGVYIYSLFYADSDFGENIVITLNVGGFRLYILALIGTMLFNNINKIINRNSLDCDETYYTHILMIIILICYTIAIFALKPLKIESTASLSEISEMKIGYSGICTIIYFMTLMIFNFAEYIFSLETSELKDSIDGQTKRINEMISSRRPK